MDSDFRKQWDKTVVAHEQLQLDERSGTEVGRTIKKFPLLTPREYVMVWKMWEDSNKTYYCFTKVSSSLKPFLLYYFSGIYFDEVKKPLYL